MQENKKIGVLFVCLGNICRSPSAQGIFQHRVNEAGLADYFDVDSCGTAPFNVGKSPDPRALIATEKFGYDITDQIARQIDEADYERFEYIIPMDRKNMMSLTAWQPKGYAGEIELFMKYHPNNCGMTQIPDPYHEGAEKFFPIIETIEQASEGLLSYIREKHGI
ncbi:Low molecular weight protein-tyrosine-phosphatase YfkJ [BD1-7 clade bacterium]|uniref:protein-tyrosine-phosphatase n=1 Tax=BD1-7 clade bacterium TaxID=2029982 RepID=A0A5S9QVE7_9GAMM|nr:Low molecular weight protein-tyrosine-phosphatase YfkJ [BD1-7 clade bacterium]CAA0122532.1 Low molecular weight protein-tyrosine-phosphatase YfkJ [BD1-7 clade bacterium]